MIAALRGLLRLLGDVRGILVASALLALFQAALLIPIGLLVSRAFNHDVPRADIGGLAVIGVAVVLLSLTSTGVGLLTRHLVLKATKAAVARLRVRLVERLLWLPTSWFDTVDGGVVRSTVVQDTERLDVISAALAAQLIPAAVIATGLLAAVLWVAPILTGALAVAFPVLLLVTRWPRERVAGRTRDYQTAFDRFSVRVDLAVRAASLIRTEVTEQDELELAVEEVDGVTRSGQRLSFMQYAAGQATGVVTTVTGIGVLLLGAAQVAEHRMSLGALLAFYALASPLRGQIGVVLGTFPVLVSGGESLRRLGDILAVEAPEPYTGSREITLRGQFALRDVHFGFREGEPVLRGVDLDIRPGEVVGLAGRNGAGKTTIWRLVLGLYRPWSGAVLADGVPLDLLDVRALRRQVAVVPQHAVLLPGSIEMNIAYGDPTASPERIRAAAALATADRAIAKLPDGYASRVGDEGRLLSGGEAQRVAIARALVGRPALLVLDEPTSSLDAQSTHELLETLRRLPWHPAVLLVSHDPRALATADRVVTLDDGRLS